MSNQDGRVVIRIDDNALKTAANLGKLQDRFATLSNDTSKYERILGKVEGTSAANLPVYEKVRKKLEEQQNAIKQATDEFKKLTDVQNSGLGYGQLSNLTQTVTDRLRNLALQGRTNTKEFKDLAQSVKTSNKQLHDADKEVSKATQDFGSFQIAGINVSNALKAISAVAIVRTLSDMGKSAIQTAGEFEQLQTSFKIMAGGAEAGEQLTNSLIDLAAKTPMTTQGLAKATRTLLSFGESSENVIDDLKLLGNISGGEEQRFQSLALAFAQVGSTGRLMGQDLLQMVNQGFNPLQIISEKTGKSMGTLKKEMEEGQISFDMVKQAMVDATSEGGRFYGLMEEQSQTLNGRLSTLDDTWQLVAKDIGDLMLPATKSAVNGMIEFGEASQTTVRWLNQNRNNIGLLTKSVLAGTTAFVAYRVAVGGQLATALASTSAALLNARNAVAAFTTATLANPVLLGGAVVAASIAGITYALGNAQRELSNATDAAKKMAGEVKSNATETPKLIAEYRKLATQASRTGEEEQRFIDIRTKLNEQYPELLSKYGNEITKLGELDDKIAGTIANYVKLAEVKKLMAKQEAVEEKYNKSHKTIWAMNDYTNATNEVTAALRRLNAMEKASSMVISGKKTKSGGFNSSNGNDSSSAKQAKQIKDAYEKVQEAYQNAQKAARASIAQYGENSPQTRKALETLQKTGAEVKRVEDAFTRLTAAGKSNFEQLQQNIQNTQKRLQDLASADVVDINAIINAKDELAKFQAKLQDVQNATVTSPMQFANNKVQQMQSYLQDRAFAGQWGEAEIAMKNQMVALQNQIKNANTQVASTVGLDWENVCNSIRSNLSSALLTPLQEGESAFNRLATIGLNAVQLVGQEIIKNLLQQITLEKTLAAIRTAGKALSAVFSFGSSAVVSGGFEAAASVVAANGAVFNGGNVIPFAKGGVVSKPTIFPMANGGTGLMGEAGAEAVMPLRRMSNGRLGVEASGNGDSKAVQVNIYNQSNSQVETRKRDDGSMDIIIKRVNEALMNERTSSGFRAAYQREDRKGLQAV